MRLIDADKFKQQVVGMVISMHYPANKANAWCELIDAQPTAYDVDSVVEQLEKEKNPLYREDGSLMGERTVIRIDKAIEIVKGGGVDG
jgi:hypothetical protein